VSTVSPMNARMSQSGNDIFIDCNWVVMGCHPVAVHICTQTIHRTTRITANVEECRLCPVFASFTLAFALQLRKKQGKKLAQSTVYILPKHPHIISTSFIVLETEAEVLWKDFI
jgi:hypothetical protein